MLNMFLGLAIALLIGIIMHMRGVNKDLRAYAVAKEAENTSLQNAVSSLNWECSTLRNQVKHSNKLLEDREGILTKLNKQVKELLNGGTNEKEEVKPQPAVQVAPQEKPTAARRQAQVPKGSPRVSSSSHRRSDDTPIYVETPVHHHSGRVYHDDTFTRDSGVCEAPRHSSHSDTGSSYSYDSGGSSSDSGSSGGGCD